METDESRCHCFDKQLVISKTSIFRPWLFRDNNRTDKQKYQRQNYTQVHMFKNKTLWNTSKLLQQLAKHRHL